MLALAESHNFCGFKTHTGSRPAFHVMFPSPNSGLRINCPINFNWMAVLKEIGGLSLVRESAGRGLLDVGQIQHIKSCINI